MNIKNIIVIGLLFLGMVIVLFAIPLLSGSTKKRDPIKSGNLAEVDLSTYKDISIDDFQRLVDAGNKLLLLDVRSEGEFRSGHIPGALNIPVEKVVQSPDVVPKRDDKAIIVYCESGFRSKRAQKALLKAGFSSVVHLKGDMSKWRSKELPIEH